ncbi:hypothetical protein PMIT1313_00071 [Prochlorococcus marinus str. MIT 1313]|uniref:hypothetical protein n=1 Tax=Prochlorococcus TaxID=1218 RepID=UPI0007B3976C|nr:hypothetical protein [Prochlorococcus marinus]KZR72715.1 hypothetical protein PMIT1313_00071 [Prochlorococcus marinus str. MIT 1313]
MQRVTHKLFSTEEGRARKRRFLQVNNDCHGIGMFASIKFQKIGIKLLCDLEKPMTSEMVIFSSDSDDYGFI